jgi:hypothetical protein
MKWEFGRRGPKGEGSSVIFLRNSVGNFFKMKLGLLRASEAGIIDAI